MTITKDQAQIITTLAIACRPTGARRWDTAGVMAALAKVSDRGLAEVVMATIRAASDRDVESPGVIPSTGSHWAESAAFRPVVVESAPPGTRCTVCGAIEKFHHVYGHVARDHDYSPPRPRLDPDRLHEITEAARAELAPTTSGPTERRSLEDLAEANPKLHANVERLRAANPGLVAPPMREVEDIQPEQADDEEGGAA